MRLRAIQRVIAVTSLSSWFPYHFIIINKKGHALHFRHVLPHEQNKFAPFWFMGRIEGIPKSRQMHVLEKWNRKICIDTKNIIVVIVIFHIVFFGLFIPWMVAWSSYPILWTIWSWIKSCPLFPWKRK